MTDIIFLTIPKFRLASKKSHITSSSGLLLFAIYELFDYKLKKLCLFYNNLNNNLLI